MPGSQPVKWKAEAVKEKKNQQVFMRKPLELFRLATVWTKTCKIDTMHKRGVYGRLRGMKTQPGLASRQQSARKPLLQCASVFSESDKRQCREG